MPRKKKVHQGPSGHFSLKTKATQSLDEQMRKNLSESFKDRPLKEVFNMYSESTESEEDRLARERAEDEREDEIIEKTIEMQKDNDERTRWY